MATIREGCATALVVVDVQVGVMAEAWEAPRAIAQVARSVERARAAGVPVLWVQHASDELPQDSAAWQWVPELQPQPDEARVHKRFNSGFEQTTLENDLARHGISHIVLAGAASNWCIRATAYAALDRGYDLTLVADAHTTGDMTLDDGSVVQAASVINDLNTAMTWLEYPGRRNAAVKADALEFSS